MPPPLPLLTAQRGLTLIEQLLVVAIAATLACVGLPSFWRLVATSEVRVAQSALINVLNHARALAVQTGRATLACPTRDGEHCSDAPAWENGWLVGFRGDRQGDIEGAPKLHRYPPSGSLIIRSTQGRRAIQFQPDGSAGGSNLTLLICHRAGNDHSLNVKVSNAGRVRGGKNTETEALQCADRQT
ncbi:GspH/FimT family pseudopilin [Dyella sp. BiH032]|uniref:GspH/FimT family pseudopilin n=1 Tax=Dyella sp. BiH032 TaxID=3075430 RepID=UPI002892DB2F|nr:GspH/FimT family pseudopilin [Dyella sp. BiH032]WNL45247.1 GspH/FimT family pseudopilin [Dyella sp. BiH032]